jgi:acetyltransferase
MFEAIDTTYDILRYGHQSLHVDENALPERAARPYPRQYVQPWTTKDGVEVIIRPIRPQDEPLVVKFHASLSDQSIYYRYFRYIRLSERVAPERLRHVCFIDYDREMVLVVDYQNPITGEREILGVGRLVKNEAGNEAEFAVIVSDRWQKRGLGSALLRQLLQIGREEKITRITADILPDNFDMQRVCRNLGFQLAFDRGEHVMKACINL